MPSFTDILNLTIDENDRDSKNDTHDDSDHDSDSHDDSDHEGDSHDDSDHEGDSHDDSDHDCERDSGRDNIQISVHCATSSSPVILQDEAGRSKEPKGNNKRSKRLDTSKSPRAKRPRLQSPPITTSKGFRKSETFDRLEFVRWLETNEHLRCINGGASTVCELLDKVRVENPGLNEIFLAFADKGEQVDPSYFDIMQLVRPNDTLIFPPKWKDRTDSGATYVWSFDIPINDLEGYCKDLEKDIFDHPHCNTDIADYRRTIIVQFRNYLDKKVPLCGKAEVFRWLYVGQTMRSPPFRRWKEYYRKRSDYQRTLSFAMNVLVDRNVHHRLVVVSSDGSENMEAVVAALLNIHVGSSGNELTAINRTVCGGIFKRNIPKKPNEQTLALQKYDPQIEMIICSHCSLEITICRTGYKVLLNHSCPVLDLRNKFRGHARVQGKLFTQMKWCPSKDTCAACIVIVPRLGNDIMKDLPLEEILGKNKKWKRKRQQLILKSFDIKQNKIMCMHCLREINIRKGNNGPGATLKHACSANKQRYANGELIKLVSNLFEVHEWCTDNMNCKSCIQIVERGDPAKDGSNMTPEDRQRKVLSNFDFDRNKIICVHCSKEVTISRKSFSLSKHGCLASGLSSKGGGHAHVYTKLFAQTKWCPNKDTCEACAVIVSRLENDIMEDLSLEEILQKDKSWKRERQRLILNSFDIKKNKVMCMHCLREINIKKCGNGPTVRLDHLCYENKQRHENGTLIRLTSNLFEVHEWCTDKMNCKSCIQIVEREDTAKVGSAVIVPGRADDIMKDLPLEELLDKDKSWKRERQRLILNSFDIKKNKIMCMHCLREVSIRRRTDSAGFMLDHLCYENKQRYKNGELIRVTSNLFEVYEWCTNKINCKSCIQIVEREDAAKVSTNMRSKE